MDSTKRNVNRKF